MKNKNSKGLVVAVIILSVLVVLLGAYIGYDKFLNKEETIQSENKEKNTLYNNIFTIFHLHRNKSIKSRELEVK